MTWIKCNYLALIGPLNKLYTYNGLSRETSLKKTVGCSSGLTSAELPTFTKVPVPVHQSPIDAIRNHNKYSRF